MPDATHRRARDRAPPPALAERFGSRPGYLVVDRPLAAEWATAGRRAHAEDGKGRALIQWHAERFAGGEAEIPSGDGGRAIFLDTGHGEAGPPQALVVPFDAAPRERARPVRIADAPARGVDRPRAGTATAREAHLGAPGAEGRRRAQSGHRERPLRTGA